MAEAENVFKHWGILELMGHVKVAGLISEEERFGSKLGRIDIPVDGGLVTQYFGGGSVYRLTPCTEEIARLIAKSTTHEPVYAWDVRRQLGLEAKQLQITDIDQGDEDYDVED